MLTINVGLNNPFTGGQNSIDKTLTYILREIEGIEGLRISYEQDEPTVVVFFKEVVGSITKLARWLDQDCIAAYDHDTGIGVLVGDNAFKWGQFDIEYFQFIN